MLNSATIKGTDQANGRVHATKVLLLEMLEEKLMLFYCIFLTSFLLQLVIENALFNFFLFLFTSKHPHRFCFLVLTNKKSIIPSRSRLTSSLKFVDIRQGRDDATFQCRLVNSSVITGFVTAVERSISVSVDCKWNLPELHRFICD